MSHHAGPTGRTELQQGLVKKFGGITATNNVTLDCSRKVPAMP
jgi:ABC-type branched-subunit amino acid transport system ATPase component